MRLYGNIVYEHRAPRKKPGAASPPKPRPMWGIDCEAHVAIRVKRVFSKVDRGSHGRLFISDTAENCRELAWFLDRYPMTIGETERALLLARANDHRDRAAAVHGLLSGVDRPRPFALAIPPREYQRVAGEALLRARSLLLADDLGTGKTCSAICALTDPSTLPALVVTLTHLPRQWAKEIGRFAPWLRVHIIKSGTPYDLSAARKKAQPTLPGMTDHPDVVIINYHKLDGWAEALAGRIRYVVFDEAQELRRSESKKYSAAKAIAEAAEYRLGLTATPIYNYGGEFHSVLDVISPGTLGTSAEFGNEWCNGEGEKSSIKDPKAFGAYLRDEGLMLRRTRADVGRELPALTKVPHTIDADTAALDRVGEAAAQLAKVILGLGESHRGQKMQASEELSNMLRQATGIAKAPYVADFVRMLVENGEQVVLFGWHRAVYEIWKDKLKDLSPALYTGTESAQQKADAAQRFQEGAARVLIMSLRSGAGLDGLQASCRTVVFGELDWSPGVHAQCVGRVHRDGQSEPVVAYYLIADHGADPTIADVLQLKRAQQDPVVDPDRQAIDQIDPERVKRLAEAVLAKNTNPTGMAA